MDTTTSQPGNDLSPPQQALWWLKKGNLRLGAEWDKAHEICQSAEGEPLHDWVHALCHLIEGDDFNAGYWFRRAGKPNENKDPDTVWLEIVSAIH